MRLNVKGALLSEETSDRLIKHVEQMGYSEHEALMPILLGEVIEESDEVSYYHDDSPVVLVHNYYIKTEIGEFPLVPNEQGIVYTINI